MADAPRDGNRTPSIVAKSDADNTAVVVEADPSTKRLKVNTTVTGSVDVTAITDGTQKTQIVDAAGDIADVVATNGAKGLVTLSPGHISTVNTSNTPLGIAGVFTGTAEDITNFGVIQVIVSASHASATDGFAIQFSVDGTNWDDGDTYTIGAGDSKVYSFQPSARYYRLVYTNGGTGQTYFRLQTILKPYYVKPSSHRIDDTISGQDDAELVKSVLTAKKPNADFTPITATAGGNLKVSIQELSDGTDVGNGTVGSETLRVTIASDSTGQVTLSRPSTPTVTSIGDTVTSTTLIAANANRKEVEFFNTSTAILYLLKGTGTASATNFTTQLSQNGYYATDITSAIQGVWVSDAGGSVLITESV